MLVGREKFVGLTYFIRKTVRKRSTENLGGYGRIIFNLC
jgi:hypothetical protein